MAPGIVGQKPPVTDSSERRTGLARVLSKRGMCSRSQAAVWIVEGRVTVDGRVIRDPEFAIHGTEQRIVVAGLDSVGSERLYLMLNKPRGLVTTASDEHGRDTVYRCFDGADIPWVAPVGRLDKASEGLLLFSNDPEWAAHITHPDTGPHKTYRVQVDCIPDAAKLERLTAGIALDGERLSATSVALLRHGEKNAWLEIVLEEGRNRQIRRLLAAFDIGVLRLIRVAVGDLQLGALPKGQWRALSQEEVAALSNP